MSPRGMRVRSYPATVVDGLTFVSLLHPLRPNKSINFCKKIINSQTSNVKTWGHYG